MSKHRIERVFGIIPLLLVHYRPFGSGQGAFEITSVLVGGFRACKMDGTVPNGGLTCRGLIEGMFVHRWLVELGGGKSFLSPILVEKGRRPRSRFTVDDCKLGKNRLCEKLLMVALYRRNADKAGQPIGALAVVGSVIDFAQRTVLAESLAREVRLPPERFFVKGAEFCLTGHPRTDFQHRLGQIMRQVRVKENSGGGKARRQGKDYIVGTESGPGIFLQFADTDESAGELFFDLTDRMIESDGVFRNILTEFL